MSFNTSKQFHGYARTFCLNPSAIQTSLTVKNLNYLEMSQLKNVSAHTLKQFGETATQIIRLNIDLESSLFPHGLLEHGFPSMFKEWKSSLTTFGFTLRILSTFDGNCLLKAVSENCVNLENLYIKDRNAMFRKVQFAEYSFPQLKELIVPKLQNISAFVNDAKNLTNLKVESVANTLEFFSFDFSNIFMKLQRLRKCEIFVRTIVYQTYDWAKIVDENFQPMTKVVVYQLSNSQIEAVLIKPPYEKSKIVIDSGP